MMYDLPKKPMTLALKTVRLNIKEKAHQLNLNDLTIEVMIRYLSCEHYWRHLEKLFISYFNGSMPDIKEITDITLERLLVKGFFYYRDIYELVFCGFDEISKVLSELDYENRYTRTPAGIMTAIMREAAQSWLDRKITPDFENIYRAQLALEVNDLNTVKKHINRLVKKTGVPIVRTDITEPYFLLNLVLTTCEYSNSILVREAYIRYEALHLNSEKRGEYVRLMRRKLRKQSK